MAEYKEKRLIKRPKRKPMLVYFPAPLLNDIREWCDQRGFAYSGLISTLVGIAWNKVKDFNDVEEVEVERARVKKTEEPVNKEVESKPVINEPVNQEKII